MKVTITTVDVRGTDKYQVQWFTTNDQGKKERHRKFFDGFAAAKAEQEAVLSLNGESEFWTQMNPAVRLDTLTILEEIDHMGISLRTVWNGFKNIANKPITRRSLGEAFKEYMLDKKRMLLADATMKFYKFGVGKFIAGREELDVPLVTSDMLKEWVRNPDWHPQTYNANLTALKNFFLWCKKAKYATELPTEGLEFIKRRRMPDFDKAPHILSYEQCRALLRAVLQTDKGLIPFVCCGLFAGLRPEKEAVKVDKLHIRGDLLHVRASHAKDRQLREVPIHPTLKAWLDLEGGQFHVKNLRVRFIKVRAAAGLIELKSAKGSKRKMSPSNPRATHHYYKKIGWNGWGKDVLRHTFASNYLPIHGVDKTVAALGHSKDDLLFAHYRALVSEADAQKFWQLTPEACV